MENRVSPLAGEEKSNLDRKVRIEVSLRPAVDFVDFQAESYMKIQRKTSKQNSFSFLKNVSLINEDNLDYFDTTVRISFTPDWIKVDDIHIACLEKGKTTDVDSFAVSMDLERLYGLSEALAGMMKAELFDSKGELLASVSQPLSLLPISQALGAEGTIDEVMASFVTPNADEVTRVVLNVSKILKDKYGSELSGYQYRDPNKALEELDAIYMAIQQEGISYCNPPASFEKTFQRVRLPSETLNQKLGTCLDFSLLFCSVAEACGLNPLLIIASDHAFAGCWLEDETAPACQIDNSSYLSNLSGPGQNRMKIIECTGLAKDSGIIFPMALELGDKDLLNKKFTFAIDILKAREEGLKPIPTYHDVNGQAEVRLEPAVETDYSLSSIDTGARVTLEGKDKAKDKFDYWEEKLLDLDLRNRLINFRWKTGAVELMNLSSEKMMENLASADKAVLSPQHYDSSRLSSFGLSFFEQTDGETFASGLAHHLLYAYSYDQDPESLIKNLARKSNTALEESGSNILFLALGLIKWYDNPKAAEAQKGAFYAPLFLIPASLPKRRIGADFILTVEADSIQLNTTLFEYFKQIFKLDFPELNGELPRKDDQSLDLRAIFNTVHARLSQMKNWTLDENFCCLSSFSFAHFVMWSDIKTRRTDLAKNPLVLSLVNGKKEWESPSSLIAEDQLDEELNPADLSIPLPADSSQIKAISDSLKGESFILDGPPGTGKSQTIANMIVNFLAHGKSVLFVAEKEVALQVVKDRLSKYSLGDFCLMLASDKEEKNDVFTQLEKALAIGKTEDPKEYKPQAEELEKEKERLNGLLKSLHSKNGSFISLYDAIIGYLSLKDSAGKAKVSPEFVAALTEDGYKKCLSALDNLSYLAKNIGGYKDSPFQAFQLKNYDMSERDKLAEEISSLPAEMREISEKATVFRNAYFKGVVLSKNNLNVLFAFASFVRSGKEIIPQNWGEEEVSRQQENIQAYLENKLNADLLKENILGSYDASIFTVDAQGLLKQYQEAEKLNLLKRFFIRERIRQTLSKKKTNGKTQRGEVVPLLGRLAEERRLDMFLSAASPFVLIYLNPLKLQQSGEDQASLEAFRNTLELLALVHRLTLDEGTEEKALRSSLLSFLTDKKAAYSDACGDFFASFSSLKEKEKHLQETYSFDLEAYDDSPDWLKKSSYRLDQGLDEIGRLSDWVIFLSALDSCLSLGLSGTVESYKAGLIFEDELTDSFRCSLYYQTILLKAKEDNLEGLSSVLVEQEISKYRQTLEDFSALAVKETAAQVTSSYPSSAVSYANSTSVFQFNKIVKSRGRNIPLRTVFSSYGELIRKVCPCFLMSPLAVAKYLDPAKFAFDAVIFDEASQIPTSEAIGALGRGKQAIIAGDQQQMPPTDFFTSQVAFGDDSADAANEDLESLLDDAIALNLPRKRLKWHYRSRHESLIAFSNSQFYANELITFPSPSNQVSHVSFRFVQGAYQPGKGINRPEAEEIVKEVLRRVADPVLAQHSIGIVTFNVLQQSLIDDLLDDEAEKNPSLNLRPGGEEIFIKNLENVQGDERDVILFSVTYGPDQSNYVHLNFGPLSLDKGERRLNVAVSRAREEMIVFSSIQPEQIRFEKAKNEGARYLHDFLAFAKNGIQSLHCHASDVSFLPEKSIADFLQKDLKSNGIEADLNVGVSSFRIDLALKSRKDPAVYVLGLLTDGSSYLHAPNAPIGAACIRIRTNRNTGMVSDSRKSATGRPRSPDSASAIPNSTDTSNTCRMLPPVNALTSVSGIMSSTKPTSVNSCDLLT
jgi:hypothetical protein